ncbi:unnamed protein product [marine sediment metagenome]|uniref:DUF6788 domain-containing protein n=1 Tax=marine sediment metagenome TaxID=412755 RepID=X1P650_9ZZZZ
MKIINKKDFLSKTIYEVKENLKDVKPGDPVIFINKEGNSITGSIRIREIRCGKKSCTKCPHKIYAYIRYRAGNKVKDKYIGVAR